MDISLAQALQQVGAVFNLPQLLQRHDDYGAPPVASASEATAAFPGNQLQRWVTQYYRQSEIGYRKYHSDQGSVHMAINEGDVFDPSGYYTQPRAVAAQLQMLQAQHVLEVGSGKGFNSRWLAQQFPTVQFQGIDLTPLHVKLANQAAVELPHVQFRVGDFNQTGLPAASVDLAFGVDCLCHAAEVGTVLQELHRVLRPGGRLVIFDGYRRPGFADQPEEMRVASQLVELGMAVPMGFRTVDHWVKTAQELGFTAIAVTDRTAGILPTLRRLQALSFRFFKRSWRARLLKLWLPPYLCQNAIAGLLMPFTCDLDQGTHSYYHLVLEKPSDSPGDLI
jgi:SAM-dependent methyltransferase